MTDNYIQAGFSMNLIKFIGWILVVIAIGYMAIVFLVYLFQHKLIYYPSRSIYYTPSDAGLNYRDIELKTKDNLALHAWYVPNDSARATVIFCHGNAGNISGRLETIRTLHRLGLNVLIFDYRGYGKSEGRPSEKGTYRDAEAAWEYVTKNLEIPANRIILMGRSLGGPVAARVAATRDPAALILESTFTSAADLATEIYPWLPVRRLIRYRYDTQAMLDRVNCPVLVAHSRDDRLIPFHHGRDLFKRAREPREFLEMEGSHGGGFSETGRPYIEALDRFLTKSLEK